jgi:Ca2+-binding RTX toxin-like protein
VAWTDAGAGGVQAQMFTLASTDENTSLQLNVAAAVTDTDGSETLTLGVGGIPKGATLTDGVNTFVGSDTATSVDITHWSLNNLRITPPQGFTGDFQLTFTATATDHATLLGSDGKPITASNSNTVLKTIDVIVTPAVASSGGTVNGTAGNDVLQGGVSNDLITGAGGNDTYQFGRGGGQDRIVNGAPGNASPSGELDFAAGIGADQLWFQRNGNDLTVDVMGTQDKITISNWFSAPSAQLQDFKTADGSRLDNTNTNISQLVQAMASYSNTPGFDPTTVTQAPNDPTLQNAITAAWHA